MLALAAAMVLRCLREEMRMTRSRQLETADTERGEAAGAREASQPAASEIEKSRRQAVDGSRREADGTEERAAERAEKGSRAVDLFGHPV